MRVAVSFDNQFAAMVYTVALLMIGWPETLQFRSGDVRLLLLPLNGRRACFLGGRFPGAKLHSGDACLLAPPSRFVSGPPRVYLDPSADVVPAPEWLREPECANRRRVA